MQKVISALKSFDALVRTEYSVSAKTTVSDHELKWRRPMSGVNNIFSGILGSLGSLGNSTSTSGSGNSSEQLRAIGEGQVKDSIESAEIRRRVVFGQALKDAFGQAR